MNKSQSTLIHVGDRKRDERVRIQMSTKWQESSDGDAERGETDSKTQMGEVRTERILGRPRCGDRQRRGRRG